MQLHYPSQSVAPWITLLHLFTLSLVFHSFFLPSSLHSFLPAYSPPFPHLSFLFPLSLFLPLLLPCLFNKILIILSCKYVFIDIFKIKRNSDFQKINLYEMGKPCIKYSHWIRGGRANVERRMSFHGAQQCSA